MADNDKNPGFVTGASSGEQGVSQSTQASQLDAYGVDRLSRAFETSAKRWELIVYPSLFGFIILAAYGFYLVFSLANDVHYLAATVDSNMSIVASNMRAVSDNMSQMSANVRTMAVSVDSISRDASTLEPMLTSIENMDKALQSMTYTTANMRGDMAVMNRNFGRPMEFVNWLAPW